MWGLKNLSSTAFFCCFKKTGFFKKKRAKKNEGDSLKTKKMYIPGFFLQLFIDETKRQL